MPYVGHNVYGRRSDDYAAREGTIDADAPDYWCDECWWRLFGAEAIAAATEEAGAANSLPDHRGRFSWGGLHGRLGFYWWPPGMFGEGACRECGEAAAKPEPWRGRDEIPAYVVETFERAGLQGALS